MKLQVRSRGLAVRQQVWTQSLEPEDHGAHTTMETNKGVPNRKSIRLPLGS